MASSKKKAEKPELSEEEGGTAPITAARINDLWAEGREDTCRERLNYWLNYAFWRGAQWVWSPQGYTTSAEIEPVAMSAKKRREQATHNRIKPAVHTIISGGMKVPLQLEVLATASDDASHQGAQTGESILRQKGLDDDWEHLREKWLTACYIGGTAGLITKWNPQALNGVDSGDGELGVLTIEDFVVEPGSPDAKEARWWIHKEIFPAEAAQAMYNLKSKPKEDAVEGGPFSSKSMQFFSVLSQRRGTQVLTYYERPSALRPEGAVAVVIGQEIVWGDESSRDKDGVITKPRTWKELYPFDDHLNLEVGVCILDPEKWTGESPITDAISPQRQYNAAWTKIHENMHRTVGSKFMYDERYDLDKQLNDDPEKPLKLKNATAGVSEPKYLTPPQLPAQTYQQVEALKDQIDDTLGIHSISRGIAGSNAPDSGYGLSILAQNDATPVGRLLKECARSFANSATSLLLMYESKVKAKRTTIVSERRGQAHPVKWSGKDLAGQTRAVVPTDSTLPYNHAGMLELGKTIIQMEPEWFKTPQQFLAFVKAPGVDSLVEILDDDAASADYENGRMADGEPMEVEEFDNHAKHIQEHNHFRKSVRYRALPENIKQLFVLHVANHMAAEASKVGQQQALAGMNPALGANPLLGGGQAMLPPADPMSQLALPPSGAEVQTPEVPQGEMNV